MKHEAHAPTRVGVVGSGPNGLAAAIAMAHAGFTTEVREAQEVLGGACRSLPLTLPGFVHDFGSAVHPLAAGSPFFRELPLEEHGLKWVHHPAPLAHPLDDGTAVTLERDLNDAVAALGPDGETWRSMVGPLVEHWDAMAPELLRPMLHVPRHPWWMARFGLLAAQPARLLAATLFRTERARALFGGLAGHSFLSLDAPFSATIALVLGSAAHAVGWPIPQGGSGNLTRALAGVLAAEGGMLRVGAPVQSVNDFSEEYDDDTIVLCDVRPAQMVRLAGKRLPEGYARKLRRFRPGPAAFKIDYALSEPIPWRAADCKRASTVHLGGTLGEITRSERTMLRGRVPERPFVLVAQPTLADPTRAPEGKHIAWVYCHVPFGSTEDATAQIEAQMERFAPGFRECVLARSVSSPQKLASMDANLLGGDISGGAMDVVQLLLRPTWRNYATPDPHLFLCSSSTPPGAGVHGMCGYHAAQAALSRW
jgi:phytoene dehydrogenase-like protein